MAEDSDSKGRAASVLEPAGTGAQWVGVGLLALVAGLLGAGLVWGTDALVPIAPDVPAEIMEILEVAASRGIFAYDARSGLTSLPAASLPETSYRLTTTVRRLGARPDTVIQVRSRDECVALAQALADLRDAIGFCSPDR